MTSPAPDDPTDSTEELLRMRPNVHVVDFLGLVAGLVPFGLSYTETRTTYVDATSVSTVTKKHMDYVALAGGGFAIACAVVGLMLAGRMRSRAVRIAVFAVLFALGGFQVIRGVLAHVSSLI